MKRLHPVSEVEVISEFLKNEFYQENFHHDRDRFERVVMHADLNDERENALRRALLFRRRGHMWRELPANTAWWHVQIEPEDLHKIRVFPRAQWRKVAAESFLLADIAERIRQNRFRNGTGHFISKVRDLSERLRNTIDTSSVMLIGIDEHRPMTILEGNHRLTAALLASPELLERQFRVLAGFSPNMSDSCWYETNFRTLWRYFKHRVSNVYDREADVARALRAASPRGPRILTDAQGGESVSGGNAILNSK